MNEKQGSGSSIVIVIVAVALVIGGGLAYARNAGIIDIFLSSEEKEAREIARLVAFPDIIDSYKLTTSNINVRGQCDNLENHPDTREAGFTGKVCTKNANAEYREGSTGKVVFVNLIRVTEGKDGYVQYMKRFAHPETLGNYNVVRLENHEFGWFPKEDFDILLSQEGAFISDSKGRESVGYKEKATGNNAVTQYFLNKYPPVDQLDPTRN